jgi:hypothetical protein
MNRRQSKTVRARPPKRVRKRLAEIGHPLNGEDKLSDAGHVAKTAGVFSAEFRMAYARAGAAHPLLFF